MEGADPKAHRPLTALIPPDVVLARKPFPNFLEYREQGGYQAAEKALKTLAPGDVISLVKASGLRGRGGAGFPTGAKWGLIPPLSDLPGPRYLVCNADEMEPGTFKDRVLLEGNPHLLVEGMLIAAYAIHAERAYIFLRDEYRLAARRLKEAITQAREAGVLGENLFNTGFRLEVILHTSAGRYICGEETALLNALEGKRAIPRTKPPYPAVVGLFGRPTVVNNVETFCNIPGIVLNGSKWFLELSKTQEGGTKIYGISGRVKRPGWWELPMGTTLRELIEVHGGGMRDGYRFRAVIPGGASTEFLTEEQLDTPMDFASVQKAGSRLGTGTMIVLDDQTCPVGMVWNLERFFAQESCGWCTPCREGLPWVAKMLAAFEEGRGELRDLEDLQHHARFLRPGLTFCALAPGAVEPLQSALKIFREDFERHIRDKRCPWKGHGRARG